MLDPPELIHDVDSWLNHKGNNDISHSLESVELTNINVFNNTWESFVSLNHFNLFATYHLLRKPVGRQLGTQINSYGHPSPVLNKVQGLGERRHQPSYQGE